MCWSGRRNKKAINSNLELWVISHFIKKGVNPNWVDSFLNLSTLEKYFYYATAEMELEEKKENLKVENIRHENIIKCLGGKLK